MHITVAIVSDTHGHLDDRIRDVIADCDYAIHAGDIGQAEVLQRMLPRRGRVIAVRGNNDVAPRWPVADRSVLQRLPEEDRLALPGGVVAVVHGHRIEPAARRHQRLRRLYPDCRAVVYGHSHKLVCDIADPPWVLNPGAAGRARTFGGPSCLVLHAGPDVWRVEPRRFSPPDCGHDKPGATVFTS